MLAAGCSSLIPLQTDRLRIERVQEAVLPMASVALSAGQLETARRLYRRLLDVAPESFRGHMGLGDVALRERAPLDAARWYALALDVAETPEERHEALLAHGRAALESGQLDAARESFARLKDPEEQAPQISVAWGYNGLGLVLLLEGDLHGAVEHMEQAVRWGPNEPRFWENLERARAMLAGREPLLDAEEAARAASPEVGAEDAAAAVGPPDSAAPDDAGTAADGRASAAASPELGAEGAAAAVGPPDSAAPDDAGMAADGRASAAAPPEVDAEDAAASADPTESAAPDDAGMAADGQVSATVGAQVPPMAAQDEGEELDWVVLDPAADDATGFTPSKIDDSGSVGDGEAAADAPATGDEPGFVPSKMAESASSVAPQTPDAEASEVSHPQPPPEPTRTPPPDVEEAEIVAPQPAPDTAAQALTAEPEALAPADDEQAEADRRPAPALLEADIAAPAPVAAVPDQGSDAGADESVEATPQEESEAAPEGVAEAISEEDLEAAPDEVAEAISEEDLEAAPEGVAEAISEEGLEALPEGVAEAISEEGLEALPEGVAEAISEEGLETLPEGVAEAISEEGLETLPEGVAEAISEEESIPAQPEAAVPAPPDPSQGFVVFDDGERFVQMGAYALRSRAVDLAARLRGLTDLPVRIFKGPPLHRVRIGPIDSPAALVELSAALEATGFGSIRSVPANGPASQSKASPGRPLMVTEAEGRFMQFGAYRVRATAETLALRLRGLVDAPVVVTEVQLEGAPLHRVRVGPITSEESLRALADAAASIGFALD